MNKSVIIFYILVLISHTYSCQKDGKNGVIKEKITGQVQKGPYVIGTTVFISELNSSLQQTGNVFSSQIISNTGLFEILNVSLSSNYVEFSTNGFYFDENKGKISIAQLNLNAIADLSDISTVNVNILTHLEKRRVESLVHSGNSFIEAKRKAQKEVLAIFGIDKEDIPNSEGLDISINNENNAILLAISIILQGKRTVGDLTELLANITNDLYQDGDVDDADLITNLRNHILTLSLPGIRTNLENRYHDLGITATIPGFEKYINDFILFTAQIPQGTTFEAKSITSTTAILGGAIVPGSLKTSIIFEYGTSIDYGTVISGDPSSIDGESSVQITAQIISLGPSTEYHFRIVAENALGKFYGPDKIFKTRGLVIDADGNNYQTLVIGNQEWMIENLKTTKYNNNENIYPRSFQEDPGDPYYFYETAYYCWYNHDQVQYKDTYGALYNWVAVNTGKLCPAGWHVPSDTEWTTLTNFLGGEEVAGGKLKESGIEHWNNPNVGATNESLFTALPGGGVCCAGAGTFQALKGMGNFWTSTECEPGSNIAWERYMLSYQNACYRAANGKDNGASVRCVKD